MPSIHYDFSASGHDAVRRAYQSVAEAAEKAAAAQDRASESSAKAPPLPRPQPSAAPRKQTDEYTRAKAREGDAAARSADRKIISAKRAAAEVEMALRREALAERRAAEERAQADKQRRGQASRGAVWEFAGNMVGYKAGMKLYDTVTSAAREAMALQESSRRLSINARQAGKDFVSPTALRKDFERYAVENPGQNASQIANAIQSFVSLTGELETGRKSAGAFATVASATGSEVGDVSQAAASIFNQFGLKTKDEMQDVLASLTFQGKAGAFELKDAASQFQRLAAAGASFGLTGAKGVKTIGGLAQIARTGTGSAEQTTTALENIFSNLVAKSKILKGQGVNVYDKTGKTRDVSEVLIESIVKSGKGNFEKKGQILQQVFGDQGIRGVRPLLAKYQSEFQGVRNRGGSEEEATAAGVKRLREEIDKAVNAPGAWDEVQKDAAEAQKDISAQMALQWERVKQTVADKVIPAFERVSPKVMDLLFGKGDDLGVAMMAVEGFADGVGLAADVLGEFVDSLYELGIIQRKEKSFAEQKTDAEKQKTRAEKKLARFDEETGGIYDPKSGVVGPMDPKAAAERAAMVAQIKAADDTAKRADQKMWSPAFSRTESERMSKDDFAKRYFEASGGKGSMTGANMVAQGVADRESTFNSDWFMSNFANENMAQRDLRRQYSAQVIGDGAAGGVQGADQIQADMAILASAAKTAADALNLINGKGQASITGTSGPTT